MNESKNTSNHRDSEAALVVPGAEHPVLADVWTLELRELVSKASVLYGLRMPEGTTLEEWGPLGVALARTDEAVTSDFRFKLGDWANQLEEAFGEDAYQYLDRMELGIDLSNIHQWQHVARRIPQERRRPRLKYSHHRAVASLYPEVADRLLGLAEERRWTKRELEDEVGKMPAESFEAEKRKGGRPRGSTGPSKSLEIGVSPGKTPPGPTPEAPKEEPKPYPYAVLVLPRPFSQAARDELERLAREHGGQVYIGDADLTVARSALDAMEKRHREQAEADTRASNELVSRWAAEGPAEKAPRPEPVEQDLFPGMSPEEKLPGSLPGPAPGGKGENPLLEDASQGKLSGNGNGGDPETEPARDGPMAGSDAAGEEESTMTDEKKPTAKPKEEPKEEHSRPDPVDYVRQKGVPLWKGALAVWIVRNGGDPSQLDRLISEGFLVEFDEGRKVNLGPRAEEPVEKPAEVPQGSFV